ncbi:MAG: Undecaprenyl-phosphate mannosyltransferase [candidate division WS2 bacterium ADurb.Bin280]|uniref:Undecaprenyl-phosphate mannosyltransferase n=1 Tax=candidate division WS2 bacterium ADurb.Bin280 TaxID=1852829 RepID=A0A1V5SDQ1_9BACT|nr:MAG: Undecaprenyl-phosphate mannosyltransferase [candidate division WS2 bacterium ADurb.Bin280]
MGTEKNLIVIPTYNEKGNIKKIIDEIFNKADGVDILVVDDSSPDGTGKIVEEIAKKNKKVHLLNRTKKEGLGRAYVAGFKWGMSKGYEKFISMDADFSHPPEALNPLIALCDDQTVAIGSRYIRGGRIVGWDVKRYINSWGANFVVRLILAIKAKDATAGFKCYPLEFFKSIDLDAIQAAGYAFQVEMLLLAQENKFKLKETPIIFKDRVTGESKISGELSKSAKLVFKLFSQKKSVRQFVKFAIVGGINTLVDWVVYLPLRILLQNLVSLDIQLIRQIAKALSFVVSALSSYYMNRKWTFASKEKKVAVEASKFMIVAIVGLLINSAAFYVVTAYLDWIEFYGLVIATAVAMFWNFFVNKNWTFKK